MRSGGCERLFVFLVSLLGGCVGAHEVVCDDGLVCPAGTTCKMVAEPPMEICATPEQLDGCSGKADLDECTLQGVAKARCYGGICLEAGCGNLRLDPDEKCDDGNAISGDGCAADCQSLETCGNGITDVAEKELCDDGNLLDHDGCSSTCQPEQLRWFGLIEPPKRNLGSMAYDPIRDRLVMFAGNDGAGTELGDTWQWNGANWEQFTGSGPNTRGWGTLAFDGKGIVLFGGITTTTTFDDTWTFDGTGWTPHSVASPGKRYSHAMAYDEKRKRVVLYGGYNDSGLVTETWEWDGSAWAQKTTAHNPGGRADAMMAYDPVHAKIVLVGGVGSAATQTWVYDGTDWTDVTPSTGAVPERVKGAMAFDTASGHLIAFGGCGAAYCPTASAQRTLSWDGTSWTDLGITAGPPDRIHMQLASAGKRLLLFGGATGDSGTTLGDSWVYEAGTWSSRTPPPGRSQASVAFDSARNRLVLFGGMDASATKFSDTWELTPTGWSARNGGTPPDARNRAAFAYDPSSGKSVLFGGIGSSGLLDDTWLWDGTAWAPQTSATKPSGPRVRTAIAFDGKHVTMFGGSNSDSATYSWDGSNWVLAVPAHSPPPRLGPAMAYDPIRKQLVMFGGAVTSTNTTLNDTWTYDGTDWTQKSPSVKPGARTDATLQWNAARQRLVLVGGSGGFDVWEWDGATWTPQQTPNEPPRRDYFSGAVTSSATGTAIYGGSFGSPTVAFGDLWELRWEGDGAAELCLADDHDGDGKIGCADPDCWHICSPLCPPGTSCPTGAPSCGDNTCDPAFESCRTCTGDCGACTPACGDFVCDPGETCPGDC